MHVDYDNPIPAHREQRGSDYIWHSPVHISLGDIPLPLQYLTRDPDLTVKARMLSFGDMCGVELIDQDGNMVARQVWRRDAWIADPKL